MQERHVSYFRKHRGDYLVTGYWIDGWFSNPGRGKILFFTPQRPDRLCSPPSLLSKRYRVLFLRDCNGRGVKLTTHLRVMPRSKEPHQTFSWRGTQLTMHSCNFTYPYVRKHVGMLRGILSHHWSRQTPSWRSTIIRPYILIINYKQQETKPKLSHPNKILIIFGIKIKNITERANIKTNKINLLIFKSPFI
jgi:hypothetical protein